MKKIVGIIFLIALLSGCTSNPYVVRTTIMQDENKRAELICTHKTAVIPWFVGIAGGVVTHNYGKECVSRVSKISDPPFAALSEELQQEEIKKEQP